MRNRALSLVLLLSLLLLAACGPSVPTVPAETPEPVAVRMGIQPWIGYGPWWIAADQGLFDAVGVEVEFIDFVTDSEVNAAFAAGEMDVSNLATHTAMKLFSNEVALEVILLEDASYDADAILAGPGIATVADLKGKSVAYEEGSTSDLLLNAALRDNNMTIADITPVPMPAADAGSALIAGQVDAAVTYEPYISNAVAQDPEVKSIYSGEDSPGLISDVLVVNDAFAEGNDETLRKLLKAWDMAVAYLRNKPEGGRAIIAEAVGSTPEELKTAFEGVAFYDLSENNQELGSGFTQTANLIAATAQSIGMIEETPDFQRMVNPNYLK